MGQKVNPHGMRVGVIKDWDSRWYARDEKVGDLIVEDYKIREYLKKTLYSAGIPNIEIERDSAKVRIYIHCSRPGVVIGKGGAEIERIRPLRREDDRQAGRSLHRGGPHARYERAARRREHRRAAREAHRLPPRDEKRHGPRHENGRPRHQDHVFRPSGRRRDRPHECYHEGTIPLADHPRGHRVRLR